MTELTYSSADGHEHVADNLGVVHHDGLHCAVQHADLQRPLLLLVLQSVLKDRRQDRLDEQTGWRNKQAVPFMVADCGGLFAATTTNYE